MQKSIVVIQTAFIGDLLLSIPLLKRVKEVYPEHQLHLVCRSGLGSMMQKLGVIDHYFEIKKGSTQTYKSILNEIKKWQVDVCIVPHQSLRTAFFVQKIKSPIKISFKKWWNFAFFSHRIEKNLNWADALRQLSLLSAVDEQIKNNLKPIQNINYKLTTSSVPAWASMGLKKRLDQKQMALLKEKFQIQDKYVVLCAGSVWNTKKWGDQKFLDLAKLYKPKIQVIFLGAQEDAPQGLTEQTHILNLCGKTPLYDSILIMSGAQLVISNDSGTMHMASVAEASSICIFGPTVLDIGYRPWNNKAIVIENENLNCRPCGKHGHKNCPIGTHECMTSIDVPYVYLQSKKYFLENI